MRIWYCLLVKLLRFYILFRSRSTFRIVHRLAKFLTQHTDYTNKNNDIVVKDGVRDRLIITYCSCVFDFLIRHNTTGTTNVITSM